MTIDCASSPHRPKVDDVPPFLLRLFGGASIETPRGPLTGRAVQRRRFGLLAMLASNGLRGVSREKLIAHLWPESDSVAGRHLLSDSVYRINQGLGREAIAAAGSELRFNHDALPSDVAAFESAIPADPERAVSLCGGPFLDGFFLPACGEFERWLDGKRARYALDFACAIESLAEGADRAGLRIQAVAWWRRLSAHDPFNSRVALRLMQSLDAAGERAAALLVGRRHSSLLEREFGVCPDADIVAFSKSLGSASRRCLPLSYCRQGLEKLSEMAAPDGGL